MQELTNKIDLEFDQQHIWHPYTSTLTPLPCYPVTGANGVYLELEGGRKVIDGMSSWWSTIHGYNHPLLNEAAKTQIDKMSHVMFGGITHQPAVDLKLSWYTVLVNLDSLSQKFESHQMRIWWLFCFLKI